MALLKEYPGRVVSQAYVLSALGATTIVPTERKRGPSKAELAQHPNAEQWSFLHDAAEEDYDPEADLFEQTRYAEAVEKVSLFDRTLINGEVQEGVVDPDEGEGLDLTDPVALAQRFNEMESRTVREANALLELAEEYQGEYEDQEDTDEPEADDEAGA